MMAVVSTASTGSATRLAALAIALIAVGLATAAPSLAATNGLVGLGRGAYLDGCSSCHGDQANGIRGRAPSLRGVGALAADFYLTTGRMPLQDPGLQPLRSRPTYSRRMIAALVAYISSLGGPAIPHVDPALGSISRGFDVFTENCAGCHQIVARGGIVTGGRVPPLQQATPEQIAEAVRIGPYLMPRFGAKAIDQHDLDSLVAYIQYTKRPKDSGGWSIGLIGPVPEGMVAWLVGLASLLLLSRLIGERTRT